MKVTGKILFTQSLGRQEPWVTKKVENDYFLSLKIIKIGDKEIKTTQDAFIALKDFFPPIKCANKTLNYLFVKPTLPPNAEDICHITLGNFPDFRIDRSVANDIDADKVNSAKSLQNDEIEFEITEQDFQLVATCNTDKINFPKGELVKANTVGFNRDAILNIKPSAKVQTLLEEYSQKIFGKNFKLWNSQQQVVPYHMTIAQTNQLSKTLENISQDLENTSEVQFKI